MQPIVEEDFLLGNDTRLVRRLYRVTEDSTFPDGLKFAYQYLMLKEGAWMEICRIDNYRHEHNRKGTHIHRYGRERAEFVDIGFAEAKKRVLELGKRMTDKLRWMQW